MAVPSISTSFCFSGSDSGGAYLNLNGVLNAKNCTGNCVTREWFTLAKVSGGPYTDGTFDVSPVVQTNGASFSVAKAYVDPNTTYYVVAHATNASGQGNGGEVTAAITPIIPSTCTTDTYVDDYTQFTAYGTPTYAGGGTITKKGFVWKLGTGDPTYASDNIVDLGAGTVGVQFSSLISGLAANTRYSFRAFTINESSGTPAYGSTFEVVTLAYDTPLLTQNTPWYATTTTIPVSAKVTDEKGQSPTGVGFVLSLVDANADPQIGGTGVTQKSQSYPGLNTNYTDTFTGLTPGRVYAVRAYATNSQGTRYGSIVYVTTTVISGFAQTQGFGAIGTKRTQHLTGFAEVASIPTPAVSSAHLTGKAETAAFGVPTVKNVNRLALTGKAETAAVGVVVVVRAVAGPTVVQAVTKTGNGNTTLSGLSTTAGRLFAVLVSSASATTSVTDSAGNTWAAAVSANAGSSGFAYLFTTTGSSPSAITSVTVNTTGLVSFAFLEIKNAGSNTAPVDVSSTASASSTSVDSGTTATAAKPNELALGAAAWFRINNANQDTGPALTSGAGTNKFAASTSGISNEMLSASYLPLTVNTGQKFTTTLDAAGYNALVALIKSSGVTPTGVPLTGFAQTQTIPTPTVLNVNRLALTGKAESAAFGTPTLRVVMRLTGLAETCVIPTPTVSSHNVLALTGKAETAAIGVPAVASFNILHVDGFGQAQIPGDVALTYPQFAALTGFAETATFGTVILSSVNRIALDGLAETAVIPTPTITGINTVPLTGLAETPAYGTVTVRVTTPLALTGFAQTTTVGTLSFSLLYRLVLTGFPEVARFGTVITHGLYPITAGVSATVASIDSSSVVRSTHGSATVSSRSDHASAAVESSHGGATVVSEPGRRATVR